MYRIIGADGKQYGPATADELRRWMADRRANASTLVQLEGTQEWKPLSSFAEFAEGLPRAIPPSATPSVNVEALAASIDDYRVDIGACFGRAWNLLTQHFWLVVGATFIMTAIDAALGSIPLAGSALSLLFHFVLWGGLDWMFLKLVRGQNAEIADAFAGFKISFQSLMLGGLVSGLLVAVGLFLCIAPGVYLIVSWLLFAPLLIMEKGLDFWPALELSRKVVAKHWWALFGLCFLATLVGLAGLLGCIIGVFITLPLATAVIVYAYDDIFGAAFRRAGGATPA